MNQSNNNANQINNRHLDFGPVDNLRKVFEQSRDQVGLLNLQVKSLFTPIRACVKNCMKQMENLSDLFNEELKSLEYMNVEGLQQQIFDIDKTIDGRFKKRCDFISYIDDKLSACQEDILNTKLSLGKISKLYLKYKHLKSSEFNLDDLGERMEKINDQISRVEFAIQQFRFKIKECWAELKNRNSIVTLEGSEEARDELIKLLEGIQSNSKRQLELTRTSLENLQELSTYLQYEDIIGQKLEHVQEILNHVIVGLNSQEEDTKQSSYYKLIPELSALTISQLHLVRSEYYSVMDRLISNAALVQSSLEQFSDEEKANHLDVEKKLQVLAELYHSFKICLEMYYSSAQVKPKSYISHNIEYYFSTVLDNTYQVINDIMEIAINRRDTIDDAKDKHYLTLLSGVLEVINKIYSSVSEIVSKNKKFDEKNEQYNEDLNSAMDKFGQLSEKIISIDKQHKKHNSKKSNLADVLRIEIRAKLNFFCNHSQLDRIMGDCVKDLEIYAGKAGKNEMSKSDLSIYNKLKQIYSMESERKVHSKNINQNQVEFVGEQDDIEKNHGDIELF